MDIFYNIPTTFFYSIIFSGSAFFRERARYPEWSFIQAPIAVVEPSFFSVSAKIIFFRVSDRSVKNGRYPSGVSALLTTCHFGCHLGPSWIYFLPTPSTSIFCSCQWVEDGKKIQEPCEFRRKVASRMCACPRFWCDFVRKCRFPSKDAVLRAMSWRSYRNRYWLAI